MVFLTRSEGTPQREKREPLVPVKVAAADAEGGARPAAGGRHGRGLCDGVDQVAGRRPAGGGPLPRGPGRQEGGPALHDRPAALRGGPQGGPGPARARRRPWPTRRSVDARRYAELVAKNFVSSDKYEQFRANSEALRATVEADRAAVERAQLQLEYCYIQRPDGRPDRPAAGGRGRPDQGQRRQGRHGGDLPRSRRSTWASPSRSSICPQIKTHMAEGELKVEADIPESRLQARSGNARAFWTTR
ncbi:MAG: hypothetical protein MZU95_02675 [Desulfomicrobium escambiense]|nr:hypothetical protein [Desulfomicrobium escambiense]